MWVLNSSSIPYVAQPVILYKYHDFQVFYYPTRSNSYTQARFNSDKLPWFMELNKNNNFSCSTSDSSRYLHFRVLKIPIMQYSVSTATTCLNSVWASFLMFLSTLCTFKRGICRCCLLCSITSFRRFDIASSEIARVAALWLIFLFEIPKLLLPTYPIYTA